MVEGSGREGGRVSGVIKHSNTFSARSSTPAAIYKVRGSDTPVMATAAAAAVDCRRSLLFDGNEWGILPTSLCNQW